MKNAPYPEWDALITKIIANAKSFYASNSLAKDNAEVRVHIADFGGDKDLHVCYCESWEEAYRVAEIMNRLSKLVADDERRFVEVA